MHEMKLKLTQTEHAVSAKMTVQPASSDPINDIVGAAIVIGSV